MINIMLIAFFVYFGFMVITSYPAIAGIILSAIMIWKDNIFPSLFPFLVISDILVNLGLVNFIHKTIGPLFKRLFKIDGQSSMIFLLSMFSGIPTNAKMVAELSKKDLISTASGTKIIMFSHFANPLFIMGPVATIYLGHPEYGFRILLVHYTTNIILGLLFRNKYPDKEIKNTDIKEEKFGLSMLGRALSNAISTLLIVLGVIVFFMILGYVISSLLPDNLFIKTFVTCILEMTSGLRALGLINIPLNLKIALMGAVLSFGGISCHVQVMSILEQTKIKYFPYLISRLLHAFLTFIILLTCNTY